jgi:hypothetical protein
MQPITTLKRKELQSAYKPDYYMTKSFTIKKMQTDYNHGARELQLV